MLVHSYLDRRDNRRILISRELGSEFFLMMIFSLTAFFGNLERTGMNTGKLTLICTLAALGAVARAPFAYLMSIQPTQFLAMISGYVFGSQVGFFVGAAAVLVSNFYAGQGPWTPWQMFSMGLTGASVAMFSHRAKGFNIWILTVYCGIWGFFYGWIMNLWHWLAFVYPLNMETFLATYAVSFPFEVLRAAGNIVFTLFFGKTFYHVLIRFKRKLGYVAQKDHAGGVFDS